MFFKCFVTTTSVYIEKLSDCCLGQPYIVILNTNFNTVLVGILCKYKEIHCAVSDLQLCILVLGHYVSPSNHSHPSDIDCTQLEQVRSKRFFIFSSLFPVGYCKVLQSYFSLKPYIFRDFITFCKLKSNDPLFSCIMYIAKHTSTERMNHCLWITLYSIYLL